jgi:hypothetical protein
MAELAVLLLLGNGNWEECDIIAFEATCTFSFRSVVAQPEEDIRTQRMEFTIVFCRTSIFRTFCLFGYYTVSNVPHTVSGSDLPRLNKPVSETK